MRSESREGALLVGNAEEVIEKVVRYSPMPPDD
jgi:hypothetical protein